jgi:DNA-binding FadR family transcriptional regulator
VSRAVLREAVRLLEHSQIAVMRRGPGGGLRVHAPAASAVADTIAVNFDFTEVTPVEVAEARLVLETLAARLAAERVSEDGIVGLRAVIGDEGASGSNEDLLHHSLAELSQNPAVAIFVSALLRLTLESLAPIRRKVAPGFEEVHRYHAEITDAVIASDSARAEETMRRHMEGVVEYFRGHGLDTVPSRTASANRLLEQREIQAGLKLPERTVRRIKRDIQQRGWPIGQVLGSEGELLARYGVSRAVFREAVRILEYYGIAGMRRGPGGGLVISEPDLDYMRIEPQHLHELRCELEVAVVQMATERLDAAGEARLAAALVAEQDMAADELRHRSHDLHLVLADLAGNRPLSFFTSVLTQLTAEHVGDSSAFSRSERDRIAASVRDVHRRIADAVLRRDAGLARHRMRRHLDALAPFIDRERRPLQSSRD